MQMEMALPMVRTKCLLVLALVFALVVTGCSVDTMRAANVTSTSATLAADVQCSPNEAGQVWWELREAGAPTWQTVSAKRDVSCAPGGLDNVQVSNDVTGLKPGGRYEFRLAAQAPAGGPVVYTNSTGFSTQGGFSPGLVSSANHPLSAAAAKSLGADIVRVEFDIGTSPAAMRDSIAAIADAGARPLLLAGFDSRIPTQAEAQNLASWASTYGPGGSFWADRSDGRLAVQQIEFGNETSYGYQFGDGWSDQSYADRARAYATRFAQAAYAIAGSGDKVGLLAQADDGGSGSANWVDNMFAAVPNLDDLVDGWTVHPYGPRDSWKAKLDRLIAQTAAHGAAATIPIDVTEYGLSSDNGSALTNNYGWPTNQTYDQAAAALNASVGEMRFDPAIGPRLRLFMIYAAHDLSPSRANTERERYFGVLRNDLGEKGAYSAAVRGLFAP
ncbi:MAG: hypothetical protein QOK00_1613 [Thermoleophilaceae bacterium]|jgi:hypothetical protein|nr:hypothetical protein [Thermoleophilaceae bacterium]